MATIRISDISPELASLVARVRLAEEFSIQNRMETLAVITAPIRHEKPRFASEILAALEKRGSASTLPSGFATNVEDGIRDRQNETLLNPWE